MATATESVQDIVDDTSAVEVVPAAALTISEAENHVNPIGGDGHETKEQHEKVNQRVEETTSNECIKGQAQLIDQATKLNAAYEAMEKMRLYNLEVTCSELGIPCDQEVHTKQCSVCLVENVQQKQQQQKRFPRLRRLVDEATKHPANSTCHNFLRIRKLLDPQPSPPCLICGSPVCRNHSSADFRKESMTVCHGCEALFSANFVIDCLTTTDESERRRRIDRMLDSYDRAMLLLRYSSQFMEPVAVSLEQTKERQNKVGLGSSSAGILSGALGIAAAATILTPAGPPLLIASLLFGGGATAVQTGTEVRDFYSEPNKLADKIIALNAVRLSILEITGILRDAMLLDHIRSDHYCPDTTLSSTVLKESCGSSTKGGGIDVKYQKNRAPILGGLTVARNCSVVGLEASQVASAAEGGLVASRNARFISRTGTNLMRTARFARFASGVLSAAILVLEAKTMSNTIQSMMNGSPCEKAEQLRVIVKDLDQAVDTSELDRECEHYLQAMKARERAMTEEEVTRLLVEQFKAAALEEEQQLNLKAENEREGSPIDKVANIQKGPSSSPTMVEGNPHDESSESSEKLSLLERIELYKEREGTTPRVNEGEGKDGSDNEEKANEHGDGAISSN